jgi:hypothetical protein
VEITNGVDTPDVTDAELATFFDALLTLADVAPAFETVTFVLVLGLGHRVLCAVEVFLAAAFFPDGRAEVGVLVIEAAEEEEGMEVVMDEAKGRPCAPAGLWADCKTVEDLVSYKTCSSWPSSFRSIRTTGPLPEAIGTPPVLFTVKPPPPTPPPAVCDNTLVGNMLPTPPGVENTPPLAVESRFVLDNPPPPPPVALDITPPPNTLPLTLVKL